MRPTPNERPAIASAVANQRTKVSCTSTMFSRFSWPATAASSSFSRSSVPKGLPPSLRLSFDHHLRRFSTRTVGRCQHHIHIPSLSQTRKHNQQVGGGELIDPHG